MRGKIANVGVVLAILGALSIILYFFDMNLRILRAIDSAGPVVGWGIRIGLLVVGAALFLLLSEKSGDEESSAQARQAYFAEPRVAAVIAEISQQMPVSADVSSDPGTYRLAHAVAEDAGGSIVHASDPQTARITLFLERGPERLAVVKDLATGALERRTADEATWKRYVG